MATSAESVAERVATDLCDTLSSSYTLRAIPKSETSKNVERVWTTPSAASDWGVDEVTFTARLGFDMFLGHYLSEYICLAASVVPESDRKTSGGSADYLYVAGNIEIGHLGSCIAIKSFCSIFLGSELWSALSPFVEVTFLS